jgi:predicted KAP-like P-loop ATPase
MATKSDFSDLPIEKPEQDLFGIEPFTKSLAKSIREMTRPEGVVIALNGPWGSGKSSAINLLKHQLQPSVQKNETQIISFNPWWFRGEEALVLAYFHELYQALKPSLRKKARKALPKLGSNLLKLGGSVAPAADVAGGSGLATAAGATLNWLSGLIETGDSVEKLRDELADGLRDQKRRFVILIDDIDRLSPDEALTMFRLIKSVGRLPNITYVLAFDREQAERAVNQKFPSEGAHYLEKIVQVSFDLPLPIKSDLLRHVGEKIDQIIPDSNESQTVSILNLFHEVVAPEIRTPRNTMRYLNALSVTWPAVAGEVSVGDFLALEAYRLFRPALHQAIRENPDLVCGSSARERRREENIAEVTEATLLHSVTDKAKYRKGLMRLFPKLESVWSNVHYTGESWRKDRRACVEDFFPIYFRFSLPDNVVSISEVKTLIEHAKEPKFIADYLRKAVSTHYSDGGTKAARLLDALRDHAGDVPLEGVGSLLKGIFSVADEIDSPKDEAPAFSIGNNNLRIHWLLRALLRDRTNLKERSAILIEAANTASLHWLVDLVVSAWNDHHPRQGREPPREEDTLCVEEHANKLVAMALEAINAAGENGSLIRHRQLHWLLYRWRDLAKDEGLLVKKWTSERLDEDGSLICFANALISYSWSQGMGIGGLGDLVAKRSAHVQLKGLQEILDIKKFRSQLEKLKQKLPQDHKDFDSVAGFLKAWDDSLKKEAG